MVISEEKNMNKNKNMVIIMVNKTRKFGLVLFYSLMYIFLPPP